MSIFNLSVTTFLHEYLVYRLVKLMLTENRKFSNMSAKRKRLEDTAENSPPEGTPTPKKRKGRITAKERERISQEVICFPAL